MKSTNDDRVKNNVMRHNYRKLTEAEKKQIALIKELGFQLSKAIQNVQLGAVSEHEYDGLLLTDRRLINAHNNCEESVMWAVKAITS